ncbi:DUF192 domain-containing protein [Acidocella sp.]|uniref:DUF192 domain-containing protein n=1 Tax=Acidocella sp. TaxID=50710 RepID=UPI003D0599D6
MAGLLVASQALAQPVNDDPTGPQPKLPTEQLTIKTASGDMYHFTVELPTTQQEQTTGEMFRTDIPADQGMLFVWPKPQISEMWMKNCPVPEDMVFIGADGTILAIAENTVPYSLSTISSGVPVKATLELKGGVTAADNINVGDKVIAKPFSGG